MQCRNATDEALRHRRRISGSCITACGLGLHTVLSLTRITTPETGRRCHTRYLHKTMKNRMDSYRRANKPATSSLQQHVAPNFIQKDHCLLSLIVKRIYCNDNKGQQKPVKIDPSRTDLITDLSLVYHWAIVWLPPAAGGSLARSIEVTNWANWRAGTFA